MYIHEKLKQKHKNECKKKCFHFIYSNLVKHNYFYEPKLSQNINLGHFKG